MLHLIPIQVLIIAHLIYVVADKYKLDITKKISINSIFFCYSNIVFDTSITGRTPNLEVE